MDSNSASRSFCVKYPVTIERDISRVHCSTFSTLLSGCDLKLLPVSPKKEFCIILPDLNPVIYKSNAASNQHIFPFTKMVVPSQTMQFRVYLIMRDFQHIMYCNMFMHKPAFKYDNGLVPSRKQAIFISNCDPCHWYIQMSWDNKAEGFPQTLNAFNLLNIELLPRVHCANRMFTMRPLRSRCQRYVPHRVDEFIKSILCVLSGRRVYYATDMFTIWQYNEPTARLLSGRFVHYPTGKNSKLQLEGSQITKFMGPTWGPPGSCRPQMGSMLAPCLGKSFVCVGDEALELGSPLH